VLAALNIGVFFPLLFVAAYRLPGGLAAVVGAGQPFVVAAAAWAMFARPTPRRQLGWALAAVAGVAMTFTGGLDGIDPLGAIAACAGTISMALGITLTRAWGPTAGLTGLASTGWQLLLGGLMIAPLIPLVDRGPWVLTPGAVLGYAWLSLVGGALAYALWFHAARRLPPTSTSLLGPLSPITAAALGWLVLDQALTPVQTLGFTVALTASVLGQIRPRRRHRQPRPRSLPAAAPSLTGGSHIRWH
ncbi:MAG: EamA family transporter, partial [bacterium]|nr:EamA family transporter [bacterium]